MTVTTEATTLIYNGDGATASFSVPWAFTASSDIRVDFQSAAGAAVVTLVEGVDYAITGDAVAGFFVNFTGLMGAPAAGSKIPVSRREPALQPTPFNDSVKFPAARVAQMGDRLARAIQDVKDEQALFFRLSTVDHGKLGPLPPLSEAIGKFFTFVVDPQDATKVLVSFSPSVAAVEATAAISLEILEVANISAEVVIVATAPNTANIGTVAGSIAAVNANAGALGAINTNAAAIGAINTNAANIASINTNAANIDNINITAGDIANVNLVGADLALGAGSFILAAPQAAVDSIAAKVLSQEAAAATQGSAANALTSEQNAAASAGQSDAAKDQSLAYLALTSEAAATAIGAVFGPGFVAKSRTVAAQPGAPANLDTYILPAAPTGAQWGAWAQHDVVRFTTNGNTWVRATPTEGWQAFIQDTDERAYFNGAAWADGFAAQFNANSLVIEIQKWFASASDADLRNSASAINTTDKAVRKRVKNTTFNRYYWPLGVGVNDGWRPEDDQSGAAGGDIIPTP